MFARADLYSLPGFHDPVSAMTHLLGAVVFLVLGYRLLRPSWGQWDRFAYLAVFAAANVFLMTMSAVYHMMEFGGTARSVMERLDHGAIFVLIAGSFTPAHGILFRGIGRWGFLILIWGLAITGITLKTVFFTDFAEGLGLSLYLGLGWLGALSAIVLARRYGFAFIKPLLWGGIAFSVGAVMEYLSWFTVIPGVVQAHELFHVLVLVGAGFDWYFVCKIAAMNVETDAHGAT